MKTAISIPDRDFERFERLAAREGMNRSEFYRTAALRYADLLEGGAALTAVANAVLADAGRLDDPFFREESERLLQSEVDW